MSLPLEEGVLSMPRPVADSAPSPKRRKLRKGTQSCWECKRRKAKCAFSASASDVCDGCRRRGTDCISQEVTEKPPSPRSNRHLVDRLSHVEASVRHLLKTVQHNGEEESRILASSDVGQITRQNRTGHLEIPSAHAEKAANAPQHLAEDVGSPDDGLANVSSGGVLMTQVLMVS